MTPVRWLRPITALAVAALSIQPQSLVDSCGRLRAEGQSVVCADGSPFRWRGVTAFRLADLIADGREGDAIAYLDWARKTGFNVVRVLATLCCWFDLTPADGQRALPRLLELAAARGLYVQVVALAGTAPDERSIDLEAQVRAVGDIASRHANAIVEIANEPAHRTQDPRLHQGAFVDRLAAIVPGPVLTAGGSAGDESSAAPPLGELVARHLSRLDDKWEMARRVDRLATLSKQTRRPVLSGEPIGAGEETKPGSRDTDADWFFAYGVLCRVFELACNFHLEAGLHAARPGPVQQAAAEAFISGTRIVPDEWKLNLVAPENAPTLAGSEGQSVGIYTALAGKEGITIAFGVAKPSVEWREFAAGRLVADRPHVKVWRVSR